MSKLEKHQNEEHHFLKDLAGITAAFEKYKKNVFK